MIGLTFAGGGNRSFYQVGLWERWRERLLPRLGAVSACSAGAAVAVLLFSERSDQALAAFARRRVGIRGIFDASRLRRGRRPFPHNEVYRATLREAIDAEGFRRLRERPFPISILCSAFPRRLPKVMAIATGLAMYEAEKARVPGLLHPESAYKVGFTPRVWDARDCESVDELVELVLASSSTPPFTSLGRFRGETLIDGSMIDNAPAYLLDEVEGVRRSLVMLTRAYAGHHVGRRDHRLYVAPREPLPIARWDYREHAPIDATIDAGRRDAERYDRALDELLAE
jgi:predicted acylesterase/phospholipase RssA